MTDMKLDTLDEVLEEVREICVSSQKDFSSLLQKATDACWRGSAETSVAGG